MNTYQDLTGRDVTPKQGIVIHIGDRTFRNGQELSIINQAGPYLDLAHNEPCPHCGNTIHTSITYRVTIEMVDVLPIKQPSESALWRIDVTFKSTADPDVLWFESDHETLSLPAGWELMESEYNQMCDTTEVTFQARNIPTQTDIDQVEAELKRIEAKYTPGTVISRLLKETP